MKLKKEKIGSVISNQMDKTLVVGVETVYRHAKYGKFVKKTKKFYVHDERNSASVGDNVRIMETRPLSKLKRWRLVEVLVKGK